MTLGLGEEQGGEVVCNLLLNAQYCSSGQSRGTHLLPNPIFMFLSSIASDGPHIPDAGESPHGEPATSFRAHAKRSQMGV